MNARTPFSIKTTAGFNLAHGFLPNQDPLKTLPAPLHPWEELANTLPKLLVSQQTRGIIRSLPQLDCTLLSQPEEQERAMQLLSYLGHAYVWNEATPTDSLPASIAIPWTQLSQSLGRPPVLSYASYALYNWERIDPKKPIELGNIALLQNFLGGIDEEWFILIHVEIEAKAIPALLSILPTLTACKEQDCESLAKNLISIRSALSAMCDTLGRMPEHCDPYIYYNRVRPYIHGWKDNPALPNGLIYEGVSEIPQFYKGETGAQSSIIPCLDALFAVEHKESPLKQHLLEMKLYMPKEHREFLTYLEQNPSLRDFILAHKGNTSLSELYNQCLELMYEFRKTHLSYAAHYIQKQSQTSKANSTEVGTGGTPFMKYLLEHLEETKAARI